MSNRRLTPNQSKTNRRRLADQARTIIAATLVSGGILSSGMIAWANGPAPGTVIRNQATGSFVDPSDSSTKLIESNVVQVTVAEVAGITVDENGYNEPTDGAVNQGDTVYFDFVITNVGNDPTQFVLPGAATITGGTANGDIQVIEYDPDGTGTSAVDLSSSNITVPSGGETTGNLLNSVANTNNGSVPAGGSITVRVTVTAGVAGFDLTVTLGDTAATDGQNEDYIAGTNDVYTDDNTGTANGDTDGDPINGEREASDSLTVAIAASSVLVPAPMCNPDEAFVTWDGGPPAGGSLTGTSTNLEGNQVTITSRLNSGSFDSGRPIYRESGTFAGVTYSVLNVIHGAGTGLSDFEYTFDVPTENLLLEVIDILEEDERVRITGYNGSTPVYPQFVELLQGAEIGGVNNNEVFDSDTDGIAAGTSDQARAKYTFASPVTRILIENIGNQAYTVNWLYNCQSDFGDAPSFYNTLFADDGARHALDSNVRLGSTVDGDNNGFGDGIDDNSNATDDTDDGVQLSGATLQGQSIITGETISLDIATTNNGVLNAWVDWNGDGSFESPDEQIATDADISGGTLSVTVPPNATTGNTYARFRYSSQTGLTPTGIANDGEVEDYQVAIATALIDPNPDLSPTSCPAIPGATPPQPDAITWTDGNYSLYTIGNNTNGLGPQESGFEQAVANKGRTLTTLNGANDFSFTGVAGPGSASSSVGTFSNGTLRFSTNYTTTNRAEFRTTTANNFISGNSGHGVYIFPEQGGAAGDEYTVSIDFTTAVNAFSFDLIDIFDTFPNPSNDPIIRYEIFADGQRIAYFRGPFHGDDLVQNITLHDGSGTVMGSVLTGQNIENTIGFVTDVPVSNVSIRHVIESGVAISTARDPHGFDTFSYSTVIPVCVPDRADAPASYGSPAHLIVSGTPQLGAIGPDEDVADQFSGDATGDDADGNDDEDGVLLNGNDLQGQTLAPNANITLNLTTQGNGVLNAWIDWNGDGDFVDSNEKVATNIAPIGNAIALNVTVPADATLGNTYARFRYSSDADLIPTGTANDGEVEDYQVAIAQASDPNVLLVKRITALNNDIATSNGDNLADYIDQDDGIYPYDDNTIPPVSDPNDAAYDETNPAFDPRETSQWPIPLSANLRGGIDGGDVMPNDEIEYTIYYLSSGDATAESVLFCDYVPTFTSYIPNAYTGSAPQASGGIGGADLSIELFRNGSTDYHTGANDGDSATYFAPGVDPANSFPDIDCEGDEDGINANPNGAVVVNLGDLPDATSDATGAYGYVRFRTRVK